MLMENNMQQQQDYNDFNVAVMTDAGKLIFSRFEDDDEEGLSSFCGFVQAIRGTLLNDPGLNHGDIQFINANKSKMYFMHVGCITLVAIAKKKAKMNRSKQLDVEDDDDDDDIDHIKYPFNNNDDGDYYTEAILKLHLEHVYSGIIFSLTDSVQYMLEENPHLDVREILGSSAKVLRNVLDDMSFDGDQSCLFLGGIDVFGPIPSEIRNYSSKVMCQSCSKSNSIIYALLSINKQIFNIIQPHSKQHQLQPFDINLLLHFINSQTQTKENELWFPICLPTLSPSGFVHGYQCCLGVGGVEKGMDALKLTIISQDPSIEEFDRLKNIANDIRLEFGLVDESKEQMLRIYNLDQQVGKNQKDVMRTADDLIWERISIEDEGDDDIDQGVKASMSIEKKRYGHHLSRSIKKALNIDYQKHIVQSYCEIASLIHFVFRYSVPVQCFESGSISNDGLLPQCYNPSMEFIEEENVSKERIWSAYQKLSLRLRINSASPEASMTVLDNYENKSCQCNWRDAQSLFESGGEKDSYTYIVQDDLLFFAISRQSHEFYATLPATTSPSDANMLCEVLADTLLNDAKDLLQCKPLSF